MKREDIEKLLGGYAAGTLTPEEREALFAAALEDQQLFDALAREEPLRELLQDPFAKVRILAALEHGPAPWYQRWLRPLKWAVPAAGLAAIAVVFMVQRTAQRPVTIADVRTLRQTEVIPEPSPVPQVLEKREIPPPAPAFKSNSAALKRLDQPVPQPAPAPAPAPPPPPTRAEADKQSDAVAATSAVDQLKAQTEAVQVGIGQNAAGELRLQSASGRAGQAGGAVQVQDARALFYGAAVPPVFQTNLVDVENKRAAPRAARMPLARPVGTQLGLRYSIMKRLGNGQLEAMDPTQPLDAGDKFALRFEPNDVGYLSVFERAPEGAWRLLASRHVERMTPLLVPQGGDLQFEGAASKELFVVFSRQPSQTPYPVPQERLDQLLGSNQPERLTYAVSTSTLAPAQTLAFPIRLTHR